MLLGVAYYPEHWPRSRWEKDARLMEEAGITRARMAEFAWSRMEPREGHFDFDWLRDAIRLLARHGIRSILGTPTPTYPAWLHAKYPDIHQRLGDGRPREFGQRQDACKNHPGYRAHARRIVEETVKALGDCPDVVAWQTDNEFGCHGTARCWCDHCKRAFQEWLRRRFGNDIAALNAAWGTFFWSQDYNDFSEISPPYDYGGVPGKEVQNPGLVLDFHRFSSDVQVEFQREQVAMIRRGSPGRLVTHNLMGAFNDVDYYRLAGDLDIVSWDNYPFHSNGTNQPPAAFNHALMRGVKQRNVWVMEQGSGPGGWSKFTATPQPGQMRLWAYQSVAHGADMISFFRWRSCRWGREQFWHGILYHHGIPQRRYEEAKRIGREFERLGELDGVPVRSEAALLFDWDNAWALEIQPNVDGLNYIGLAATWHRALMRMGVCADAVAPDGDWDKYKLLIAPTLHLVAPALAARLKEFVRRGGVLILGPRSGVKDEENAVVDALLPGLLRPLAGCHVEEYDAFGAVRGLEQQVGDAEGNAWKASAIADVLVPARGARVLLTYLHHYYAGKAAAVAHRAGRGRCIYVGAVLEDAGLRALLQRLLPGCAIPFLADLPESLEIVRRAKGKRSYTFYLNHADKPLPVNLLRPGKDLLSGRKVQGRSDLEPFGVRIVKE